MGYPLDRSLFRFRLLFILRIRTQGFAVVAKFKLFDGKAKGFAHRLLALIFIGIVSRLFFAFLTQVLNILPRKKSITKCSRSNVEGLFKKPRYHFFWKKL